MRGHLYISKRHQHFDAIIAGGGVIGSSVAYHLSKRGLKPLVIEQATVTSGTTWHAAGLIGQWAANPDDMACRRFGNRHLHMLEEKIGEELGYSPSFKRCGSMQIVSTKYCKSEEAYKDRIEYWKRIKSVGDSINLPCEIISASEAAKLCPNLNFDDLKEVLWIPDDGSAIPSDVTQCYIKGARIHKGEIIENTRIEKVKPIDLGYNGFEITASSKTTTTKSSIERQRYTCDIFVNAGGQWAREIARKTENFGDYGDINVPLASLQHFYLVTRPSGDGNNKNNSQLVDPMMPVVREPDGKSGYLYYREWGGGLLCGIFEPNPLAAFENNNNDNNENDDNEKHWEMDNIVPKDWEFGLFDDNFDHIESTLEELTNRIPNFENMEIQMVNGPESFTTDGKPLIGEIPNLLNYYIAAAMNSAGIVNSYAIGHTLSNKIVENEWAITNELHGYLNSFDIQRYHSRFGNNIQMCVNGAKKALSGHTGASYPFSNLNIDSVRHKSEYNKQLENVRRGILYDFQQREQCAMFGSDFQNGYGIPLYFAGDNQATLTSNAVGYGRPFWQDFVNNELNFILNNNNNNNNNSETNVICYDRSFDSKWLIQGKDSKAFLEQLCGMAIDDNGTNDAKGLVSVVMDDNTNNSTMAVGDIWHLGNDKYLFQSDGSQNTRIYGWLNKQYITYKHNGSGNKFENVTFTDVSNEYTILHLIGNDNAALSFLQRFGNVHSISTEKLENLDGCFDQKWQWIEYGNYTIPTSHLKHQINSFNNCITNNSNLDGFQLLIPSDYAIQFYKSLFLGDSTIIPGGYFGYETLRVMNGQAKYGTEFHCDHQARFNNATNKFEINHLRNNKTLVKGMVKNGKNIVFGGEPVKRGDKEYIGSISNAWVYEGEDGGDGDHSVSHFFAWMDLNENELNILDHQNGSQTLKFPIQSGDQAMECSITDNLSGDGKAMALSI